MQMICHKCLGPTLHLESDILDYFLHFVSLKMHWNKAYSHTRFDT